MTVTKALDEGGATDLNAVAHQPVAFGTFTGSYCAPMVAPRLAVLMLSPFGYEDLCARTFWARLAATLAENAIATLRFDYPGTGDALDGDADGLDGWRNAAVEAADRLRTLSGHIEIVVLGQGLGALLGALWADPLGPVAAAVLLEPPGTGRTYLRGLKAWGTMVATTNGTGPDPLDATGYGVAGFTIPQGRLAAIRSLDPAGLHTRPFPRALLLEQPGGLAGRAIADGLSGLGVELRRGEYVGYAALMTDPTSALVPMETIDAVLAYVRTLPCGSADFRAVKARSAPPALCGNGFTETHVRFGGNGRLAGVLCRPAPFDPKAPAVIIANAGRDHHIGWARSAVDQSRAMAQAGLASLRFDASGIGDSPAAPNGPDEMLYSRQMVEDLRAAADLLESTGHRSLAVVGRCSGAWAAFTLAAEDIRIRSVALVNTGHFLWDPDAKLADLTRFAQRRVGDLGATFLRRNGFSRLLKGQLDWRGAMRFVARQAKRTLLRNHAGALGRLTAESRRYHDLHAMFARLRQRSVRMLLAYAEHDSSIDELHSFMGPELQKLDRYPNVAFSHICGADHNFTHRRSRDALVSDLIGFFGVPGVRRAQGEQFCAAPETNVEYKIAV